MPKNTKEEMTVMYQKIPLVVAKKLAPLAPPVVPVVLLREKILQQSKILQTVNAILASNSKLKCKYFYFLNK